MLLSAGQETTGSTLYLAMIELALNTDWQKRMQEDLDRIFGDSPPSSWNYDSCLGSLLGGTVSATMNESENTCLKTWHQIIARAQANGFF